jgi:hypothetical protein
LDTTTDGSLKYTVANNDAYMGHTTVEQTFTATDAAATVMTAPKFVHKIDVSKAACETLTTIGTCSGWSGDNLASCAMTAAGHVTIGGSPLAEAEWPTFTINPSACHLDYECVIPDAMSGIATCDGISPNRKITWGATSDVTKTGIHTITLKA